MSETMTPGIAEPCGIGHFLLHGQKVFLPVSQEELHRADAFAKRILTSFHFRTGRHMLVISLLDMFAQFMPLERGAMDYGLIVCNADDSPFEAARIESIIRRFDVAAVAAVSNEALDGLSQLGYDPSKLLAEAVVWAYPEACERIKDCQPHRFAQIGPALGMECVQRKGLHIDRFEWDADSVDGEIHLSSKMPRSVQFDRFATGVRGRVTRDPCACGTTDPRIQLD